MKKQFVVLAFIIALFANVQAQDVYNIEVKDIDGVPTTLDQVVKGELIVLDFWATWCKPCVRSIPSLVELSKKFSEDKVQFIGVNEDSPRGISRVKPMVKSLKIPYEIVLDTEQRLLAELRVQAYPTLIILDRNGVVLHTHVGFVKGDEVELEKKIKELLE